jgi:hypothetical protein
MIDGRDRFLQLLADIRGTVPPVPATPAERKKTPRAERKQVVIDSINSFYFADLVQVGDVSRFRDAAGTAAAAPAVPTGGFGAAGFGAPGGMQPGMMEGDQMAPAPPMVDPAALPTDGSAPVAAAGGHGYVVRIAGTTPYRQAESLLSDTIVKGLEKFTKDKIPPGYTYAVEQVKMVEISPLRNDQAKLTAIKAAYDAALTAKTSGQFQAPTVTVGGGFGSDSMEGDIVSGGYNRGGFGGAFPQPGVGGAPGAAVDPELAFKDREFPDEDIRDDQQFVVVAVVALDPPPAQPADGSAAPADPAAPPADAAATPAP